MVCVKCGAGKPANGAPCPNDGSTEFKTQSFDDWGDDSGSTAASIVTAMWLPTDSGNQVSSKGPAVHVLPGELNTWEEKTQESNDPVIGVELGGYRIVEKFASGGMGVLYRGVHPIIGKSVIVKLLKDEYASNPEQMRRLLEEARAINDVRHDGVVDVYGFGQLLDGRGYVVMELLEGEPLDVELARAGKFSIPGAVDRLIELCGPLSAAHKKGVLHRDLKPANIFVSVDGEGKKRLKVLDFGLAKRTANTTHQTAAGQMFGTPNYMAPEIARQLPAGAGVDIYALGVILYEMLTGQLPFLGDSPFEVISKHVTAPIPAPSQSVPAIPPGLDAIVRKAMDKAPEGRFPSVEALRDALIEIRPTLEGSGISARSLPRVEPGKTAESQRPRRGAIIGVGAGALVVAGVVWVMQPGVGPAPPPVAPAPAPAPAPVPAPPPPVLVAPADPGEGAAPADARAPAEPTEGDDALLAPMPATERKRAPAPSATTSRASASGPLPAKKTAERPAVAAPNDANASPPSPPSHPAAEAPSLRETAAALEQLQQLVLEERLGDEIRGVWGAAKRKAGTEQETPEFRQEAYRQLLKFQARAKQPPATRTPP